MNRRQFFTALAGAAGAIALPEPPRVRVYSFASPEWIARERLSRNVLELPPGWQAQVLMGAAGAYASVVLFPGALFAAGVR